MGLKVHCDTCIYFNQTNIGTSGSCKKNGYKIYRSIRTSCPDYSRIKEETEDLDRYDDSADIEEAELAAEEARAEIERELVDQLNELDWIDEEYN